MKGRVLLLGLALASACSPARSASGVMLVLQQSPVAGFQHHAGPALFPLMQVGDVLTLEREPDNPYDPRAVRVLWRGSQIGYAPRADNADLARFMDKGTPVEGRILHLQSSRDPWKRVLMEIVIVEETTKP
ncbi:MAG: HIRAN domain-containing protein [Pseudomonadota bacterium]